MATATTTQAPWTAVQPFLKSGFNRADALFRSGGPQYFPQSTVAQFGPDSQQAMGMFRDTAMGGTPVPGAASNQIASTLQGDYLNSNPYLDAMYNNAASRVTENYQEAVAPSIGAQFDSAGRFGSGMYQNAMQNSQQQLGDSLGMMASNLYGGNFQNERNRQMQAASMAPSIAPLPYYDASQLMQVGEMGDTMNQRNINDQFNRFTFNQNRPYDNLNRFMSTISGNFGNTTTQPVFQNSTAQNLGLGLAGIGLADSILGSTSYGGIGGLLGSFF